MTGSFNPAKTGYSRVFLTRGGARADRQPEYQSHMRAGGVEQSFGDIERIEAPSELELGQYVEIGKIQGSVERATSSLVGRYAADLASELLEAARARCPVDLQVHFGECTDPRVFNDFTKSLVWEDVSLSNYSTDELGSLSSDENAPIMETSDLSIGVFYEVLPLSIQERAPDVVTNEITDIAICDRISCGGCDDYSEGCEKIFALQGGLLGSPGTGPDVIWSDDGGKTWSSDEITTLLSTQSGDAIACLDNYAVVVSNAAGSYSYKLKDTILAGTGGGWSEVTDGFNGSGAPNDIASVGVGAFIAGNGGYVYWLGNVSSDVETLDAGIATSQPLNAIHALSDELAVAVGDTDSIIYTTNRHSWVAANATGGGNNLQSVWMRTENEWWVVDDGGEVYVTYDQGDNWNNVSLPGTGISALYSIEFATNSVAYISGVANSSGAVWRTYNAGYSWVRLPEGYGNLPGSSTQLNVVATCRDDPNFIVMGGIDSGDDGVLLTGAD